MSEDQAVVEEPKAEEKSDVDVLDQLIPRKEPVERTLEFDDEVRTYTQAPLSFFGKLEFFGLIGDLFEESISDETVGTVVAVASGTDSFSADSLDNAESLLTTIAKLTHSAPEFLRDCYCIFLNVPKRERSWAREAFEQLSDDDAMDILEVFIDQNAEDIRSFFTERVAKLVQKAQKQFAAESGSSKPSKRTRRRTRKQ